MISYQATHENYVYKYENGIRTTVPTIEDPIHPNTNIEFIAYKKWLENGGVLLPADSSTLQVPESISPAQGRLMLLEMGLAPTLQSYIESLEDPEKSKASIAYYATTEWRRDSPFLCAVAEALNLSSDQLDTLFIKAAEIVI